MSDVAFLRARVAVTQGRADECAHMHELVLSLEGQGSPGALAWALGVRARLSLLGREARPRRGGVPGSSLNDADGREGLACALPLFERTALLAFDPVELAGWQDLGRELSLSLNDESLALRSRLVSGWLNWLAGTPDEHDGLADLAQDARALQLPSLVVEVQALRALLALASGDVAHATELARRASRMSRTEAIVDCEILANITLARVRRNQNRPHLSLRILNALVAHAPPAWRDWIEWEAILAGVANMHPANETSAAAKLNRWLTTMSSGGDSSAQDSAQLLAAVRDAAPLRDDVERAFALLMPDHAGVRAQPAVLGWRNGATSEVPAGVSGLAFTLPAGQPELGICARIIAAPGRRPARIAALGVAGVTRREQVDARPAEPPTQPRTDTGLAVLAFADAPIAISDYFRIVYEYEYEPSTHATMFGMHLLRMRQRLGDAASVERTDGTLELIVGRPVLLRDPRCEEPLPQKALRVLARGGAQGARGLAAALGVPLRTMQRVLKELVVDEDLERVQDGREILYRVEDTTFSEPTRSQQFDHAGFPETSSPGDHR